MITSSFVSCSSFYISRLLLLQISRTLFNIIWKEDFHHKFYLFTGFTQTPPTPGPKSAYLSLTKAFCRYSLNYFDSFLSDFAKVLGYVSKLWDRNPTEHFARGNRVSQIPAILFKNKARQSKMKTRFSYDGQIIFVFS